MSTDTCTVVPQYRSRAGTTRRREPVGSKLFAMVLVCWVVELFLVARCATSIYETSWIPILFAVAYVGCFWMCCGLVGKLSVGFLRTHFERSARQGAVILAIVTFAYVTALLVYASTWVMFFQAGRFPDIEAARFVLWNHRLLAHYVLAAEPHYLVLAALVVLATIVTVPAVFWFHARQRPSSTHQRQFIIGVVVMLAAARGLWNALPREESMLRAVDRIHALRFGVHPSLSLLLAYYHNQNPDPIPDCLSAEDLVPIELPAASPSRTTVPAYSVIFVAVESLRHDVIDLHHQGQAVLPNINSLTRSGAHFTRAYAQSTHSDYADVCLVSSLYPLRTQEHHYYNPSDPWPRTLIYDVLKPLGYATAIISSQNERWGGMADFLDSPSLDLFYHPETAGRATMRVDDRDPGFAREVKSGALVAGKFPDSHTTDRAIDWISEQVAADRRFFLSMNLQSSHFPYLMPADCPRPFQPCELKPSVTFVSYPEEETPLVRNAYYNAIHECDRQIGRLVAALRRLGQLEKTILVVTGENGEAFHECGTVNHARQPVEPALHVACVIHAPALLAEGTQSYPFEHVDLVPTVLGLLNIPSHPNFQGIDVFAKNRPPLSERLTYSHVNSSLAHADTVTLAGRWKLTYHYDRPATLHDIANDPLESTDLAGTYAVFAGQLGELLSNWRKRQLAYYHYPRHYLQYYPPKPPRWNADIVPPSR